MEWVVCSVGVRVMSSREMWGRQTLAWGLEFYPHNSHLQERISSWNLSSDLHTYTNKQINKWKICKNNKEMAQGGSCFWTEPQATESPRMSQQRCRLITGCPGIVEKCKQLSVQMLLFFPASQSSRAESGSPKAKALEKHAHCSPGRGRGTHLSSDFPFVLSMKRCKMLQPLRPFLAVPVWNRTPVSGSAKLKLTPFLIYLGYLLPKENKRRI